MQFIFKALTFVLIVTAPMSANADRAACERMFNSSPAQVDRFERTGDRNYEIDQPGFGYAVSYRGDEGGISVFYYDKGENRVSDALLSKSFEKSIRDIRRVATENDRGVGKFRKSALTDDTSAMRMLALAKDTDQRMQLLAMGTKNNCMIKIRFSTGLSADETKDVFHQFKSALETKIFEPARRGAGKK